MAEQPDSSRVRIVGIAESLGDLRYIQQPILRPAIDATGNAFFVSLRDQIINDMTMHIGQPVIASLESIGQSFMIES